MAEGLHPGWALKRRHDEDRTDAADVVRDRSISRRRAVEEKEESGRLVNADVEDSSETVHHDAGNLQVDESVGEDIKESTDVVHHGAGDLRVDKDSLVDIVKEMAEHRPKVFFQRHGHRLVQGTADLAH